MKTLMMSLDTSILTPSSPAADRMREYGNERELFILIPTQKKLSIRLSDAVYAEGTGGGKIVQFFRLTRRGRQLRKEGVQEITVQDPFFTGLAGLLMRTRLLGGRAGKKIRLEVQLHGDFFPSLYYRQWGIRMCIARFVLARADVIRVAGERIRQSLLGMGVLKEKIVVRPVVTDVEALRTYAPRIRLHEKYPEFEKIFLVLSRFDPVKNILWLLDVFAEVRKKRPRAGLVLVGDGPEKTKIEKKIAALGLSDAVRREPWTEDPWSYLKTADALLLPSLSEGYGLSVVEAVAAGTPAIITDVGVANYEVQPGPRVTIVPVNDKQAFIQAILSL